MSLNLVFDAQDEAPSGNSIFLRDSAFLNLARLDFVSIRLAVLCAELGSLSAAAKRMHCSISTGSHRLTALEDCLSAQLFLRDHRGLHVTEAGEHFIHHARLILEQVHLLKERLVASERPPELAVPAS